MLLESPALYITGQSRLEAFWRTFIADQMDSGESPAPEALGDSFFQTVRLAFVDRFAPSVDVPNFETMIQELMPKVDLLGKSDDTGRLSTASSVIDDCRAFVQEQANQFGGPFTRDAEKQSLFMANSHISMWRRTFCTSQGYMGLGPESLEVEDLVFIIAGSPVPFALRKTAQQGRYRLVGETYVHGLMQGEALPQSGEVEWEEIHIA
ncbi:MAG: hypothetical protein Q9181_000877 [Wetmoreana brouardii]